MEFSTIRTREYPIRYEAYDRPGVLVLAERPDRNEIAHFITTFEDTLGTSPIVHEVSACYHHGLSWWRGRRNGMGTWIVEHWCSQPMERVSWCFDSPTKAVKKMRERINGILPQHAEVPMP